MPGTLVQLLGQQTRSWVASSWGRRMWPAVDILPSPVPIESDANLMIPLDCENFLDFFRHMEDILLQRGRKPRLHTDWRLKQVFPEGTSEDLKERK